MLGLAGCSNGSSDSNVEYQTKIYELDEEQTALVINPTQEYVMAALHQVESIIGVEAEPEPGEGFVVGASKVKDCKARIYFSSSLVDQNWFDAEESTLEKGTNAGGSIDIYDNVEDAIARDKYLHEFDDNWIMKSGGHCVAGTIVIRTSEFLDADKQTALADSIVAVLTSGEITDEVIESALAEINDSDQERWNGAETQRESSEFSEKEEKESEVPSVPAKEGTKAIVVVTKEDKIRVGNDSDKLVNKHYEEVVSALTAAGFTNIETLAEIIAPDLSTDGICTKVTINGKDKFSKDEKFNPEDSVTVYYVLGQRAKVPAGWTDLLERHYKEIEELFIAAGFTNVVTRAHEIDYDEDNVFEGSVVNISIGGNAVYEADAEFLTNIEVCIDYRVKPVVTPEPIPESRPLNLAR